MDDYTLIEKKGQGTYGCVMKAKCNSTGQEVAIKLVQNFRKYTYEMVKVLREIQIMKALTDMGSKSMSFFPNLLDIVTPKGASVNDVNSIFIVMSHVDFDLNKLVKSGK